MEWILERLFTPEPRFLALSAPTGSGKSLLAVLSAILYGQRSIILTATKALQEQYSHQLGDLNPEPLLDLVDIRGTGSYRCQMDHSVTADLGPCRVGVQCSALYCPHKSALGAAMKASQVLTNYACWMYNSEKLSEPEKNEVGLLVLDEAHKAHSQLSEFRAVEFQASMLEEYELDIPEPTTD
ncbi:MAG: DEAD/DEAH box helicase, partial [Dehalococcoidia bacterium]|nr:DEAD/DEAH box helicase [Dehalococcoidia bacterium]